MAREPGDRARRPGQTPAASSEHGRVVLDDHEDGGSLPLPELDMPVPVLPPMPRAQPPPVPPAARPPTPPAPALASATGRHQPQPTAAASSADARDPPDRFAAMALADYGPPPVGIVGSVLYAIGVLARRRDLRASLRDASQTRAQSADALVRADVELGRAILASPKESRPAQLAVAIQAVERAHSAAGQQADVREQARARAADEAGDLERRIDEARARVDPHRDHETKLATQLGLREGDLKRARARLSRIDIELRALAAAPDAARRDLLESDREARKAEVTVLEGQVRELTERLGGARRELAASFGAIAALEEERRRTQAAAVRVARATGVGSHEARALEEALRALAEDARRAGVDATLAPEASRRAAAAAAALRAREADEALRRAAIGAYDVTAFRRGASVLAVCAALVLLALVLAMARACG